MTSIRPWTAFSARWHPVENEGRDEGTRSLTSLAGVLYPNLANLCTLVFRHRILYYYNLYYSNTHTIDLDNTHMLTISLVAQKGGVGKTTVARCLGVAFERSGVSTAILDMDPQASAALWAKRREAEQPEVLPTVLPLLGDTLKAARESVDLVLIDTPPKNADVAIAAARVSDLIIVPCRAQIDDIETLSATKQILDVTGDARTFVLLNGVPPNVARREEAAASITGHPEAPFTVCPHAFGHRAAFGDSSVLGLTPQEYEPKGKAAQETENVHKYINDIMRKINREKHGQKTKHTSQAATVSARR